jgi:hypothetical protein
MDGATNSTISEHLRTIVQTSAKAIETARGNFQQQKLTGLSSKQLEKAKFDPSMLQHEQPKPATLFYIGR